jgi:hypothetical protein
MDEINSNITDIKLELGFDNVFKIEIINENMENKITYNIELDECDAAKLAIGICGVFNKAGKFKVILDGFENMIQKTLH